MVERKASGRAVSQALRDAVRADGRGQNELARLAGLDKATLSRFVNGGALRLWAFDALCNVLGLKLARSRKNTKGQRE